MEDQEFIPRSLERRARKATRIAPGLMMKMAARYVSPDDETTLQIGDQVCVRSVESRWIVVVTGPTHRSYRVCRGDLVGLRAAVGREA